MTSPVDGGTGVVEGCVGAGELGELVPDGEPGEGAGAVGAAGGPADGGEEEDRADEPGDAAPVGTDVPAQPTISEAASNPTMHSVAVLRFGLSMPTQ